MQLENELQIEEQLALDSFIELVAELFVKYATSLLESAAEAA